MVKNVSPFYWVMEQQWEHVLFAHWPIPRVELQALIPEGLEIDTFADEAWVSIVPFQLSYRPRGLGLVPFWLRFTELNLRTYVKHGEKPGVYFFCLDASDRFSVEIARKIYHLNYFNAQSTLRHEKGRLFFSSVRTDTRENPAHLSVEYEPADTAINSEPGTLTHWLTERYRLFAQQAITGQLFTAQLTHTPWCLKSAEALFHTNTLAEAHGLQLPKTSPLLHYARKVSVRAGLPHLLVNGHNPKID